MLVGPVLSFNMEEGFVKDCLGSTDFVANTEIYLKTLPQRNTGGSVHQRNKQQDSSRAPNSPLCLWQELLYNCCAVTVAYFSSVKGITDEALTKKATDEICTFYWETITVQQPLSYISCTGIMVWMGDAPFMKQAEDIVNFSLGLTTEMPAEMQYLKLAPPPIHTVLVFASVMDICLWTLSLLSSINEHATINTFTTSIQ